jgi:hypothetical protein
MTTLRVFQVALCPVQATSYDCKLFPLALSTKTSGGPSEVLMYGPFQPIVSRGSLRLLAWAAAGLGAPHRLVLLDVSSEVVSLVTYLECGLEHSVSPLPFLVVCLP